MANQKYTHLFHLFLKVSIIMVRNHLCKSNLFCSGLKKIKRQQLREMRGTNTVNWASQVAKWQRIHLPRRRRGFNSWVGKMSWKRKWQPTRVFLPGKSHGQRSPASYSTWGCKQAWHNLATEQQQSIHHLPPRFPSPCYTRPSNKTFPPLHFTSVAQSCSTLCDPMDYRAARLFPPVKMLKWAKQEWSCHYFTLPSLKKHRAFLLCSQLERLILGSNTTLKHLCLNLISCICKVMWKPCSCNDQSLLFPRDENSIRFSLRIHWAYTPSIQCMLVRCQKF